MNSRLHAYEEGRVLAERDYSRNSPRYSTSSRRPSRSAAHPGAPRGIAGGRFPFPGVHRLAHRSCPSSKGARPSAQGARTPAARPTAQQLYPRIPQEAQAFQPSQNARARACSRCLLAAVCATGGYALWYSSALDGALSLGTETDASVEAVLTPAEPGQAFLHAGCWGRTRAKGRARPAARMSRGDSQRST